MLFDNFIRKPLNPEMEWENQLWGESRKRRVIFRPEPVS